MMANPEALPWDKPRIDDTKARELIKEKVLEYTLPPFQKGKKEIARLINRSESFVYGIREDLVNEGKLRKSKGQRGHIIRSAPQKTLRKLEDLSKTAFAQRPEVQIWINSLRRRGIQNADYRVGDLWKICRTLHRQPAEFLEDPLLVQTWMDEFDKLFREGKSQYIAKRSVIDPVKQSQSNPQHYIENLRDYIKSNNKQIPEGILEVKREYHSVYANIRLTDQERLKGIKFMAKFSSILGILFTIHHELGVRIDTLFKMKPMFERKTTKIEGVPCEYYVCLITEKKQKQQYEKLIITPRARNVVKAIKTNTRVHNYTNIRKGKNEYNQRLREFYATIGKIDPDPIVQQDYEKGTQEYYYVNNPSHVLRHSCVHWLMRISGERAEDVASLFWEKPDTLKVYAKTSMDSILQQGVCYYCNPPEELDNKYKRFCTIRHALVYYNNGGKQK